jgi:hypothetical protein
MLRQSAAWSRAEGEEMSDRYKSVALDAFDTMELSESDPSAIASQ